MAYITRGNQKKTISSSRPYKTSDNDISHRSTYRSFLVEWPVLFASFRMQQPFGARFQQPFHQEHDAQPLVQLLARPPLEPINDKNDTTISTMKSHNCSKYNNITYRSDCSCLILGTELLLSLCLFGLTSGTFPLSSLSCLFRTLFLLYSRCTCNIKNILS